MNEDFFDDANIPESAWFKFEQVGDKVMGIVAENPKIKEDKGRTGEFGDQRVFKLRQEDGTVINVGIKTKNSYLMERTEKVREGDKVGFKFTEEIPASVKGHHPAKSIQVYVQQTAEGDAIRDMERKY